MNKKKVIAIKIGLFLVIMLAIAFVSFYFLIIGTLTADYILIYSVIGFFFLGLIVLFLCIFLNNINKKIKIISVIVVFVAAILPNGINYVYQVYDRSFTRLSEDTLGLAQYRPFESNTKAVYLDEVATLTIKHDLPQLDGARALYPVYAAFAQAVYPNRTYSFSSEVGYNNTIEAYNNLIERKNDIIFVAAPSKEQLQLAEDHHVTIKLTPIGREAFVFFVNAKNPVSGLTTQQIKDIYSKKIRQWQDVGGNRQTIRTFQRNIGSGSQSAFLAFMQNTPVMPAPIEIDEVRDMGAIITRTADYANYSNAIGFSFRYFSQIMVANNEIKLLSIDGIYPTKEAVKSGVYPLSVDFYAATLADNHKPNVAKMLNWILSPQGQYLIEKTGYIPL